MARPKRIEIACPHCGGKLDGAALAKQIGAEYSKRRKPSPKGMRTGGRPAIYDHTQPDCQCARCRRRRAAKGAKDGR